jgi:hypothetical protein
MTVSLFGGRAARFSLNITERPCDLAATLNIASSIATCADVDASSLPSFYPDVKLGSLSGGKSAALAATGNTQTVS